MGDLYAMVVEFSKSIKSKVYVVWGWSYLENSSLERSIGLMSSVSIAPT